MADAFGLDTDGDAIPDFIQATRKYLDPELARIAWAMSNMIVALRKRLFGNGYIIRLDFRPVESLAEEVLRGAETYRSTYTSMIARIEAVMRTTPGLDVSVSTSQDFRGLVARLILNHRKFQGKISLVSGAESELFDLLCEHYCQNVYERFLQVHEEQEHHPVWDLRVHFHAIYLALSGLPDLARKHDELNAYVQEEFKTAVAKLRDAPQEVKVWFYQKQAGDPSTSLAERFVRNRSSVEDMVFICNLWSKDNTAEASGVTQEEQSFFRELAEKRGNGPHTSPPHTSSLPHSHQSPAVPTPRNQDNASASSTSSLWQTITTVPEGSGFSPESVPSVTTPDRFEDLTITRLHPKSGASAARLAQDPRLQTAFDAEFMFSDPATVSPHTISPSPTTQASRRSLSDSPLDSEFQGSTLPSARAWTRVRSSDLSPDPPPDTPFDDEFALSHLAAHESHVKSSISVRHSNLAAPHHSLVQSDLQDPSATLPNAKPWFGSGKPPKERTPDTLLNNVLKGPHPVMDTSGLETSRRYIQVSNMMDQKSWHNAEFGDLTASQMRLTASMQSADLPQDHLPDTPFDTGFDLAPIHQLVGSPTGSAFVSPPESRNSPFNPTFAQMDRAATRPSTRSADGLGGPPQDIPPDTPFDSDFNLPEPASWYSSSGSSSGSLSTPEEPSSNKGKLGQTAELAMFQKALVSSSGVDQHLKCLSSPGQPHMHSPLDVVFASRGTSAGKLVSQRPKLSNKSIAKPPTVHDSTKFPIIEAARPGFGRDGRWSPSGYVPKSYRKPPPNPIDTVSSSAQALCLTLGRDHSKPSTPPGRPTQPRPSEAQLDSAFVEAYTPLSRQRSKPLSGSSKSRREYQTTPNDSTYPATDPRKLERAYKESTSTKLSVEIPQDQPSQGPTNAVFSPVQAANMALARARAKSSTSSAPLRPEGLPITPLETGFEAIDEAHRALSRQQSVSSMVEEPWSDPPRPLRAIESPELSPTLPLRDYNSSPPSSFVFPPKPPPATYTRQVRPPRRSNAGRRRPENLPVLQRAKTEPKEGFSGIRGLKIPQRSADSSPPKTSMEDLPDLAARRIEDWKKAVPEVQEGERLRNGILSGLAKLPFKVLRGGNVRAGSNDGTERGRKGTV